MVGKLLKGITMDRKVKLFLVEPNELSRNLAEISNAKLRRLMTNFIMQFEYNKFSKPNYSNSTSDWSKGWDDWTPTSTNHGVYSTKGMTGTYNEYFTEKKFEEILDEFITGLLAMNIQEKSEFLKSLEMFTRPIDKSETRQDNIYNIINTIYYNHSENDLFNSIKVSKLEKTGTIVLSSYNLTSIETIKAKLVKEGIVDIRYRIIKNPYNNKKIHTIMYDKIGEK
jgi:hypothetical protein